MRNPTINSYDRYMEVYRPKHPHAHKDGYIPKHRIVYEEAHNCCLLPWVDIHHKNKIKNDNRPENLEPLTKGQHVNIHRRFIPDNRKCTVCGSSKTYRNKTSGNLQWRHVNGDIMCARCYAKWRFSTYGY